MNHPIVYLVCAVSGAGKSWICRQLPTDKYAYLHHDRCWRHSTKTPQPGIDPKWEPGAVSTHLEEIVKLSKTTNLPIVTECPFGERPLRESIERAGIKVIPVFVIEPPMLVAQRYANREGKHLPAAAFTRATTIKNRALEWKSFYGTSGEVLEHLRGL